MCCFVVVVEWDCEWHTPNIYIDLIIFIYEFVLKIRICSVLHFLCNSVELHESYNSSISTHTYVSSEWDHLLSHHSTFMLVFMFMHITNVNKIRLSQVLEEPIFLLNRCGIMIIRYWLCIVYRYKHSYIQICGIWHIRYMFLTISNWTFPIMFVSVYEMPYP